MAEEIFGKLIKELPLSTETELAETDDLIVETSPVNGEATTKRTKLSMLAERFKSLMGADLLLKAYPVGCIYLSVSNTTPAALFGGEWKLISQNRMLMGCADGDTAGATGGSNTKTIAVENLPAHNHTATTGGAGKHTHIFTGTAVSTDQKGDHNHQYRDYYQLPADGATAARQGVSANTDTDASPGAHTKNAGDHMHSVTAKGTNSEVAAHTHTVTVSNTGGGKALDVTNAYTKVFMWQRIA